MKILNSCESATAQYLVESAGKYSAHVSFKMSLKDVLESTLTVAENRLPKDEYDFVRRSHLDFVVGRDYQMDFALEYDGPYHAWTRVIASDTKKNKICNKLGVPIFRIYAGALKRGQEAPVVELLVDMFYTENYSCSLVDHKSSSSSTFHDFARRYVDSLTGETVSKESKARLDLDTFEDNNGYTESRITLCVNRIKTRIGSGRCHVPAGSAVCAKRLADYLAYLDASNKLTQVSAPDSSIIKACRNLVHGGADLWLP